MSRATRPRPRTSSRWARSPRTAARRCASKAWAAIRSRATSASSTPRRPWARRCRPGRAGCRCRAAPGRCARCTLDCNHIPDAAMTLAVMALYADGTTRLDNIASWRVKETDRIAAMAAELRKLGAERRRRRRLHRGHAAAALAARRHPHLRRPPHGDVPVAGRLQPAGRPRRPRRAGLPLRILDPRCVAKTFPDYFETLFGVVSSRAGRRAGDHRRRPHRLRQGHAGRRAWPRGWATTRWTPARCTAPPRWPRCRTASRPTTRRRWPGWPACWTCASTAPRWCCAAVPVSDDLRREDVGSLASRIAALPAVREALHGLQLAFRRAAGAGGRRARHGHRDLPRRGAQGVPHRQRRRSAQVAGISS